ncbi:thioredoxin domain-containing protein [Microlunatus panaciterrae]|uniref:Uncharacterized protein YyaL (SSP411 family) n=1 Tax=Microlunatus panaciterrae TaxID=400768 RepID=A0ABS2RG76_9ACTN|nr:thioredoxin domain-containing protein [Microlunatus panaciterrae]MBM7797996.1 uncharacterized protein YyaL (SSP411 family) [Microlunatus panaciterrae]
MNRLENATSPYLLQHKDNPVDWQEWGEEAFARARELNRPILLSVGYAACHWCHVMAHESFEDVDTAAQVNADFVPVKVDREERPDVDAVYMQATQAMTGQGGWPMTVFLTPQGKPFYAGTYFPPIPHHGLPSFRQVLDAVATAWRERPGEVLGSAEQIVEQLAQRQVVADAATLTAADLTAARDELARGFDPINAGFGSAPKFPPSMVLEALLRLGDEDSTTMAEQALTAMARGGIYDQLGGGFARYSVDAQWVVPHFEKMLYDNALLLGVYAHWWRLSDSPLAARVVHETVDWLVREMRTDQGGFAASLDADSLDAAGKLKEGAFYAWDRAQLVAELGEEDGGWAAECFTVTDDGTFEHGLSTLQLLHEVDPQRLQAVRQRLFTARERRSRPGRDDKVVAAWNGWLVESLVQAAMLFDRSDWLAAAVGAAELLWQTHWVDGRLRRTSRDGRVGDAPGILEDYAAVAQAFARVGMATLDPAWVGRASELLSVVEEQFADGSGGYFDTAADAEALYARPKDPTDNATPSGLSSVVHAFELMAQLGGDDRRAALAEAAAATNAALVRSAPRFAGWLFADAVSRTLAPPVQVAIVGAPDDPATAELRRAAYLHAPAGSVIVAGLPDSAGFPLLANRTTVSDQPTAYVCRHFICRLPVTDLDALVAQLERGQPAR